MTLFVSDLHLGRGLPAESRAAERDLLDVLDAHGDTLVTGGRLYLVGDVFEQWLEYRHLVPKGFVRLLGRLADLADRGARVTYLVGNRDPWHLDGLRREIGLRLVRGSLDEAVEGRRAHLAHGDGYAAGERLGRRLRPFLRHRHTARLYRMALPGDAGYALVRWVARRFGTDGVPQETNVEALRAHARQLLADGERDLVVLGHVHQAELAVWPEGTYLNPGYWFGERTFGRLDADGLALLRWRNGRAENLASEGPAGVERPARARSFAPRR